MLMGMGPMGSGASSRHQGKLIPIGRIDGTSLPCGNTDQDRSGSTDMVEGSVHWLFSIVDKEKREKEWLAAKYDEQTAQVRALEKEVAELRRELHACRASVGASSEEMQRPRTPMRGMAPEVIAKVPGDAVAVTSPGKTSVSALLGSGLQEQTSPVSPSGAGKLKERRGLRTLSIDTPIRARNADAVHVESKDNTERKEAQRTPPGEAVSSAAGSSPAQVLGPREKNAARKTGSNLMGHDQGEPGSALLRRRREDWQIMATVLEKEEKSSEAESPKVNDLQIKASKVLDLDCPMSPKRLVLKRDDF